MDTHFPWLWCNWLYNGKAVLIYFFIVSSLYVYIIAEIIAEIILVEVDNYVI